MTVGVVKPDGSLIFHYHIKGAVEQDDQSLILLHEDRKELIYPPGEWSYFKGERAIIINVTAETVQ